MTPDKTKPVSVMSGIAEKYNWDHKQVVVTIKLVKQTLDVTLKEAAHYLLVTHIGENPGLDV